MWFVASLVPAALAHRADYVLGANLEILCERMSPRLNCDLFQPSPDAYLRSRWVESGIFSETRSEFFRCCHLRHTGGVLDLKFPEIPNSNITLIATPAVDMDEEYIAAFARNFRSTGAYVDVGSGSAVRLCSHAEFPGLGVSVEPVEWLADKIPSACPHMRVLVGNQEGSTSFYEINFQALHALYGEEPVPQWMREASTPIQIFRVLKENAITREVGTFVEDLFMERRLEMTTIRSILEIANISDRKLLLRVSAGGSEPLLLDELVALNPEILILDHEFMELADLAKFVQALPGACAISMKYLYCTSDANIFGQVFFDNRTLLRTLDI